MVIIGSDHTGVELKNNIKDYFKEKNIDHIDVIKENDENDDYPDIALKICNEVLNKKNSLGIAICGTGIGISIACNKIKGIRAAMCTDKYMAKMARNHNDANVLCLGARLESSKKIEDVICIIENFLEASFEGGRHKRRVDKISMLENLEVKDGN